jgi:hypothetical protein
MRRGDAVGVREGDADQPLSRRRTRVQADGAAVRAVAHAHGAHARLARQPHRQPVGVIRHHDAQPAVAMDLRRAGPGEVVANGRPRLHRAGLQPVEVMRQPRDAVRVHAPQAGLHQRVGHAARVGFGHAHGLQAGAAPDAQGVSGAVDEVGYVVAHGFLSGLAGGSEDGHKRNLSYITAPSDHGTNSCWP